MFSRPLLVLVIFLLVIVLFVFLRFTPSDYLSLFFILSFLFYSLYCPPSIYTFWLPITFFHFVLFILLIVLSAIDLHLLITYHFFSFCPFYFTHCIVRHRFTPSDYLSLFFILSFLFYSLYCPPSIYTFWLPITFFHFVLFILLIVLSAIDLHLLITYHFFSFCPFYFTHCIVRHRFTPSDYLSLFFILSFLFYSLYCPPSIYTFWLPITFFHFVLFILLIVLFAIGLHLLITYHFFSFCPFYFTHCIVRHRFTPSDYLSLFSILSFLFYSLYCPPSIYTFWLPITFFHFVLFILLIVLSAIDLHLLITYHFFSFCPFYFTHCIVRHRFTPSDYLSLFFHFVLLFYSLYCPPSIYTFWLPITFFHFVLFILLIVLSAIDLHLLITYHFFSFCPFYFTHCIVRHRFTPSDYLSLFFILSFLFYSLYCSPSVYTFWLPITFFHFVLFILLIVLSAIDLHLLITYHFFHFVLFILLIVLSAIDLHLLITTVVPSNFFFYSMYCASFDLRLLITPLVPSTFSVPLVLLIVLCVLRSTASDYPFGTFDLFCPSSFTYCIVRPSIYGFWLPLWYLRPFLSLFFYSL